MRISATVSRRPEGRGPVWRLAALGLLCVGLAASLAGQSRSNGSSVAHQDITGMYSFLSEGEFVQVTIDDVSQLAGDKAVTVSGFVSRLGQDESDKGHFIDQFFKSGSLDGDKLTFLTKTTHGIWYEFFGHVARGEGKSRAREGYFVLHGVLRQHTMGKNGHDTPRSREVELKSFPNLDDEPNADGDDAPPKL